MDEQLRRAAATQHGVLTREQLGASLTAGQVERWLAVRRLEPMWPGVYRVGGAPESWEQRLHAACLAAGRDAAASHRSASRLWGMADVPALRLEINVGRSRAVRLAGVVAHRSNLMDERFVTTVEGIPVTTPERTVIDLASVVGEARLGRVLDEAVRRRLLTYESVQHCLDRFRRRGRRRTTVIDHLLETRTDDPGPGESDLEAKVLRWLRTAGLPMPASQLWIVAGGRRFRLDLAYPEWRVGVELDGWLAHGHRSAFDADRERGNALAREGWRLYHFTSRSPREVVVRTVRRALGLAA